MTETVVLSKDELREVIRQSIALFLQRSDWFRPLELMTKNELAEYLRCEISMINKYMKKGLPVEYFGSKPLFRKLSIDAWLQKKQP